MWKRTSDELGVRYTKDLTPDFHILLRRLVPVGAVVKRFRARLYLLEGSSPVAVYDDTRNSDGGHEQLAVGMPTFEVHPTSEAELLDEAERQLHLVMTKLQTAQALRVAAARWKLQNEVRRADLLFELEQLIDTPASEKDEDS